MPQKVIVIVRNEQKGLYASMGYQLSGTCDVTFVTDNRDTGTVIRTIFGKTTPKILIEPDIRKRYPVREKTISDARTREESYGLSYALIVSMDRGLGRGYLSNVEGYPRIRRENWSFDEKVESINQKFEFFEELIDDNVVLISKSPEVIPNSVCDRQNVKHFHLLQARYGERMMWSDGDRFLGSNFSRTLDSNLNSIENESLDKYLERHSYELDLPGAEYLSEHSQRFTMISTIKDIIYAVARNIRRLLLLRTKKNSYGFFAWLPVIYRRLFHYKFLESNGTQPNQVTQKQLVYFPLHMEPERTLLQYCCEFNNVFEAITVVSKALPSDVILVLKEHRAALGHRSGAFYKNIVSMGNVVFSKPDVSSWDWIKEAEFVVTMAGTVGEEAVHLKKPVVTFGRDQRISGLPTVFAVETYENVRSAVEKILFKGVADIDLKRSQVILGNTTLEVSFEMAGYSNRYKSDELELCESSIALKNLLKEFPGCININETDLKNTN